jgi:glutathione synthase/RimK-type ligase-like ATP-grasp enzyme
LSSAPIVAFVTWAGLTDLVADDRLAATALADLGVRTDAVCWDDRRADWLRYDAVVLRSTWDYHHRVAEFRAWIDRMETLGARVWNRPDTLRWNMDKRYLGDLSYPHLAPPPTAFFAQGSRIDLAALLDARGWDEAVMKPTISADGFATERTSRAGAAADQAAVDAMIARSDVMIQPLVPEIRTNGELSLMFFGGAFSHAVRKRPQSGEFRVQERLGGVISAADAPVDVITHARGLLDVCAPGCLYARVDLVLTEERAVLMEIELVEPSLFLEHAPASAPAFAAAIRRLVTRFSPASEQP